MSQINRSGHLARAVLRREALAFFGVLSDACFFCARWARYLARHKSATWAARLAGDDLWRRSFGGRGWPL